jgi:hypothetical protein
MRRQRSHGREVACCRALLRAFLRFLSLQSTFDFEHETGRRQIDRKQPIRSIFTAFVDAAQAPVTH